VPSATPYMRLMDIYVSPSLGESFGMVIVEAMALGLPVVSFASGGPAEIIDNGLSGLLIPAGDTPGLIRAIESLVADSSLRGGLARAARERFQSAFAAQRMTRQMERLFQDLCVN